MPFPYLSTLLFHFKCTTKMKELALNGTRSVPVLRIDAAKFRELLNRVLPRECRIETAQDAWYVGAVAWLCVALVFPPVLPLAAWCVLRAKKAGKGGAR